MSWPKILRLALPKALYRTFDFISFFLLLLLIFSLVAVGWPVTLVYIHYEQTRRDNGHTQWKKKGKEEDPFNSMMAATASCQDEWVKIRRREIELVPMYKRRRTRQQGRRITMGITCRVDSNKKCNEERERGEREWPGKDRQGEKGKKMGKNRRGKISRSTFSGIKKKISEGETGLGGGKKWW